MGSRDQSDELEKLIQLATAKSNEPEDYNFSEAERFVAANNISPGSQKITLSLLWYTYLQWADKPVPRNHFLAGFKKLFQMKRIGEGRYFLLSPEPFDLSLDTHFKIIQATARARARKQRYVRKYD